MSGEAFVQKHSVLIRQGDRQFRDVEKLLVGPSGEHGQRECHKNDWQPMQVPETAECARDGLRLSCGQSHRVNRTTQPRVLREFRIDPLRQIVRSFRNLVDVDAQSDN